jgi:hypothetical protein
MRNLHSSLEITLVFIVTDVTFEAVLSKSVIIYAMVCDQIFCIHQILEIKWEYNGTVHQMFIDFKKAYDSVRREALYNILIEFGIPRKLVGLIKMCLNETYSGVRIGKNLSDKFTIENGLKQGNALSPLLFNFVWNMPSGGSKRTRRD